MGFGHNHGHSHGHSHGHEHSHHHEIPKNFNSAFAIGIALNLGFVIIEGVFGFLSHSLALLADAGHNLGDVGGLVIAWGASYLAAKPPTQKYTYGLRRSSILAALLNSVMLLVAVGAIALESIRRFNSPAEVSENTVIWVAAIGIIINTATALMFMRGKKHDINIRGAYMHMAADAAISAGVVIAGLVMRFTGWHWLDATISLLISVLIAYNSWDLLKDSFNLAMDAVPESVNHELVKKYFMQIPGVAKIHDLHIWAMSTTDIALTVHLVKPNLEDEDSMLHKVTHELEHQFGISHTTIQIERGNKNHICHQEPDDVI